MAQEDTTKKVEEAQKLAKESPAKAEQIYKDVMKQGPGQTEASAKNYETALIGLGEVYRDQKRANDLAQLVQDVRSVLSSLAKAKTAKLGTWDNIMSWTMLTSIKSDNCSTSSPRYQTPSTSRSPPQSHV